MDKCNERREKLSPAECVAERYSVHGNRRIDEKRFGSPPDQKLVLGAVDLATLNVDGPDKMFAQILKELGDFSVDGVSGSELLEMVK